jgi:putative heme iron utilization protein
MLAESALVNQESGILEHMNADHAESLCAYCQHVHNHKTAKATMIGIDPDGFDVRSDDRDLRFNFASPIQDAQQARAALVALAASSKLAAPHS